ncbi:MAG: hypothetical protein H3C41_08820 [Bacteroidales bacterium]|nr:hypothetical protein [Bacteroidales bacterium]
MIACSYIDKPIASLQQLEGLWVVRHGPLLFEEWKSVSDSALLGRSFSVNNADTFLIESMRLENDQGKWRFYSRETDRMTATETVYELQHSDGGKWVFENPKVSYPQRLTFIFESDSVFLAVRETLRQTKRKEFEFSRIK